MRGISAHLGRGLDNAVANWPLSLLSLATQFAMVVILIAGALLALVPIFVAGALQANDLSASDPEQLMERIVGHPLVMGVAVLIFTVVTIPVMLVHSFNEAGKTRVLVDADAAAPLAASRASFGAFTPERWWRGGIEHWWATFLIINIVWAIAFLFILLPLMIVGALLVRAAYAESGFALPCAAAAALVPIVVIVSLVGHAVSQLAKIHRVTTLASATASIRAAWHHLRREPLDVVGLVIALWAITIGALITLVCIQFATGALASLPPLALFLIPAQLLVSVAQSLLTAFLSTWTAAAFVSLARFEGSRPIT